MNKLSCINKSFFAVLMLGFVFLLWIVPFSDIDAVTIHGILSGTENFPPVLEGVLNNLLSVTDYNPFFTMFVFIFFSLANITLVYFTARRLFSECMAIQISTVYLIFPLIAVNSTIVQPFVFIHFTVVLQMFLIVKGKDDPVVFFPIAALAGFAGILLSFEVAVFSFILFISPLLFKNSVKMKDMSLFFLLPLSFALLIYYSFMGISFALPQKSDYLFYGYNFLFKNNAYNADMTAYIIIPATIGVATAFVRKNKLALKVAALFSAGLLTLSFTLPFISRSYYRPDITHLHILVFPLIFLSINAVHELWTFRIVFLKTLSCFIAFMLVLNSSINSRELRYPQKSGISEAIRKRMALPGNIIDLSASCFRGGRGLRLIDQYLYAYPETKALNNDHVFLGTGKPGGSASLYLTAPSEFLTDLVISFTAAPDFGVIQISLNNNVVLDHYDLYSEEVSTSVVTIEDLSIIKGVNKFTFKITDKNESSKGYNAGIDSLKFRNK